MNMKKTSILLCIAAVSAAVSCARVDELTPSPATPLTFHASLGSSRTAISDGKVTWAAGDKITVYDAAGKSEEFTVTADCSDFTFTSDGTLGSAPYYAIAGYGSVAPSFNTSAKQFSVALPAAVTAGSFGEADLIASTTSGDTFNFHHVFAVMKMSILSSNITKLEFEAEGISTSGNTKIGFASDGSLDVTYDKSRSKAVIDGITGPGTYYFAANPAKYSSFTIYITFTDKKMRATGGSFTATAGKVMNFGTLDGAAGYTEWQLVTDASTLSPGDEIIIADAENDFAMGTERNGNNHMKASAISKSADKSVLSAEPSSDVQVFTLAAGSADGSFALYTGSAYIAAASSSYNYINTSSSVSANASWLFTISSDGSASIVAQGTRKYNSIYYIADDSSFGCSNTADATVAVYRKVEKTEPGPELKELSVFLDETALGVYNYNAGNDVVTPIYQYDIRGGAASTGSDQYAFAPSGNVVFRLQCLSEGLLAEVSFSVSALEVGKSYSAATMLYGITGYSDGTSTRSFTVKKEKDGKYWILDDGSNLGFIITTK